MTPSMIEHKKRFMRFLEKKFNLLIPTASLHTQRHSPTDSIDDAVDDNDYTVAIDGGGSASIDSMHVVYTEEDLYTIDEEDLPTFVSMDEIHQYYTMNSNVADSNHDNMNNVINNDDDSSLILIDHSDVGQRVGSSSSSSSSSTVRMRWGQIDRILEQSIVTGDKLSSVDLPIAVTDHSYNEEHSRSAAIAEDGATDRKKHSVHVVQPLPSVYVPALSSMEKEKLLFSWRYPLIYASMELSNGSEDMTMAAMRILDEYGSTDDACIDISMDSDRCDDEVKGKYRSASTAARGGNEMRYQEAIRFIEYEVARSR
jgi:hypothetical protein